MATVHDFSVIRELRHERGLTLKELAEASGLSYPTVALIETNKAFPSLRTIDAIAGVLQIPTGKLVSLASRKKAQTRRAEFLGAKILKDSGINHDRINVAHFGDMKIFRTLANGGWLVLAGHEINDDGRQTTRMATLRALCEYAQDPANGIWLDTVEAVTRHIHKQRAGAEG